MNEKHLSDFLTTLALKRRKLVFAVFALLVAGGFLLSGQLGVVADPEDLLHEDNPVAREFLEVSREFGFTSTLIVAIEGDDPDRMISVAHSIADQVRANPELAALFSVIQLEHDPEYARTWGLLLSENIDDIPQTMTMLAQDNLSGLLRALNDRLEETVLDDESRFATQQDQWDGLAALSGLEQMVGLVTEVFESDTAVDSQVQADRILASIFAGSPYNFSPEKDMLIFSMIPGFDMEDLDALYAAVHGVDAIVSELDSAMDDLQINIGGEVAWAVARHEGVGSDTMAPTLLALVMILILFFFSFSRLRKMVLAVVALFAGIMITVGAIVLTVGHISFITAMFAVILLGLGIDFAIHLVSNYDDFRLKGLNAEEAMRKTMQTGGAPIFLGGITTSAAFFALGFASSPAIREFGIICGLGVLLTLVTMLTLFPALIMSFGGSKKELKRAAWRPMINFSFMGSLGRAIEKHPFVTLGLAVLITVLAVIMIPGNSIDYDPMNNSPRNHRYTRTQRRIMDVMELSPFICFARVDSVEEARDLSEQLRELGSVSRVASVADLLPPEREVTARLQAIREAAELEYPRHEYRAENGLESLVDELQRLEWNIIELGDLAVAGMGEDNLVVRRRNHIIREIIGAEVGSPGREITSRAMSAVQNNSAADRRLADLNQALAGQLLLQRDRMLVDRAPGVADIPEDIRRQLVAGDSDRFLVTILPSPQTQNDSQSVFEFHSAVRAVNPGITGSLPLYVALVREIFTEAIQAGIYVALAVIVLLFIIFRNLKMVLLAVSMVVLGIVWMFGLLPLAGTQLALTAGLVFPLLIGIGTDDAMHILHRYRHEGQKLVPALRYSGKAVLLTTLTTMLAFGSLAVVGEMATIAAIGWLLFIGFGTCFLATVVALPACLRILELISQKFRKEGVES